MAGKVDVVVDVSIASEGSAPSPGNKPAWYTARTNASPVMQTPANCDPEPPTSVVAVSFHTALMFFPSTGPSRGEPTLPAPRSPYLSSTAKSHPSCDPTLQLLLQRVELCLS